MSRLQIVRPEATLNLCTNPSVEKDTTGWANSGLLTFARSATWQARGAWSIHAIADTVGDKAQAPIMTPTSGLPYTATARVRVVSGTWKVTYGTGSQTALVAGDYDISITVTPGSGSAIRLELEATALASGSAEAYIDGVQYEQKDHSTSYCDGDQDGCVWTATAHASTSSRSAEIRSGGKLIDLMDDSTIGFLYSDIMGTGIGPLSHLTSDLGIVDGARLQRIKTLPAIVSFAATMRGVGLPGLHAVRRALVDLVKPDLVSPLQPCRMRYSGSGTPLDLDVHYLAGLEGNIPPPSSFEKISAQFIAYDPRWKERFDVGVSLAPNANVTANRIIAQIAGVWTALGTGANDSIWTLAVDNAGRVFVGGKFTSIGGVAANRAAYWDPADSAWHAMSTGLNNEAFVITIGADGRAYYGGSFTTAGGTTVNRVAAWDPVGAAWAALSGGVDAEVDGLAFGADGKLYAGGIFDNADGNAALGIAKWDGSAWSDVGGVDLRSGAGTGVQTIAVAPNGDIYAGGNFSTGGGADFEDLAKWNGTAWAEVDSSFNAPPLAILFGLDGFVYVGGTFTSPFPEIARYNGSQLLGLASGANGAVVALGQAANGDILVGGYFSKAGSLLLADRIARWTGSAWKPLVIDLPGSAPVQSIVVRNNGDTYLAGQFAGTAVAPGVTTVTNPGSSEAYPVFRITGPGTLRGLVNLTTGQEILFDALSVATGETVTVDLRPGRKTVRSSIRGSLLFSVLAGSELASWALLPGSNSVAVLCEPVSPIAHRTATFAQSASGSNIVLNKPAGLANGDTLTALLSVKGGSGTTITPPAGWTLTSRVNVGAAGTDLVAAVYQKTITNAGAEAASYTFTLGAAKAYTARLIAWTGADTTTPIAGVVTANGSAITSLAIPSTTSTIAGSRLEVLKTGGTGTVVISTPASWSSEYQDGTATAPQLATNYEALLGVGDTGAQTVTVGTAEQIAVIAFILNPAAGMTQPVADLFFRPRHWGAE